MKVHSDELYQLIQSLESHEKGYFKRFIKENKLQSDSKTYVLLFDTLDSLPEYDENELRRKLKNKVNLTHLSKLKNYLMETILESLEFYHYDTTPLLMMNKLLARIEILLKKTFYKKALSIIHKAQALADKYEQHYHRLLLDFMEVDTNNAIHQSSDRRSEETIELIKKHQALNEKISNTLNYYMLRSQTHSLHQKMYIAKTEEEKRQVKELLKSKHLKNFSDAKTFISKFGFLYAESGLHFMAGHMKEFTDNYMKQIELFETLDKEVLAHYALDYLTVINNAITPQSLSLAESLYKKGLVFYEALPAKLKTKQKRHRLVLIKSNYAEALLQHLHYDEALSIALEELKFCSENGFKHYNSEIELNNISFSAAFITRDYSGALKYVNYALGMKESPTISETACFFRIANMMVHYELGNVDTLPYLAQSAERYLKKNNRFYEFEKSLVDLFEKKLVKTSSVKETQHVFKEFYGSVKHLLVKSEVSQGFPFEYWILSKIENKPLEEVLREHVA